MGNTVSRFDSLDRERQEGHRSVRFPLSRSVEMPVHSKETASLRYEKAGGSFSSVDRRRTQKDGVGHAQQRNDHLADQTFRRKQGEARSAWVGFTCCGSPTGSATWDMARKRAARERRVPGSQ